MIVYWNGEQETSSSGTLIGVRENDVFGLSGGNKYHLLTDSELEAEVERRVKEVRRQYFEAGYEFGYQDGCPIGSTPYRSEKQLADYEYSLTNSQDSLRDEGKGK